MTTRTSASTRLDGFTLIEMLVVIAIIAILATLSTVAIGRVMDNARKTQARTVMQSLVLAIKAYETENNLLPSPVQPRPQEDNVGGYDTSTQAGKDLIDILTAKDTVGNPKQIRHYSPPVASGDAGYTDGRGLIDIWGQNGYRVVLDYNGDGQIANPYDSAGGEVHASVIIYSAGANKRFDVGNSAPDVDDVKSWQ